ncbi:hypothetical protein KAH81_07430 [bacterium]|nr:hypothetical protein [bacterium]
MKNSFLVTMGVMLFAGLCMAWPTGGPYQLRWGSYTNGGTETEPRVSGSGYQLTDNLGYASYVTDSFLTDGTTYINRPGYRKVEWDEQTPITSVDDLGADTISSAPNFIIAWGGADTTTSDGIGWGIRYYDVRFRRGPTGVWEDWYLNTSLTSSMFGPFVPDTVFDDTVYYFICRAYDLAGNVEEWPATWQAWAKYNEQTLEWIVYNYDDENDWTILDSVGLNATVSADSASVFIVKNTGTETIDIGIKGNPSTGWDLGTVRGIDKYALRARFNDNIHPPILYELSDAIYDSGYTWASGRAADPDTLFGPGGFNIQGASADSVYRTENLWLQLKTPSDVTTWIFDQTIRIDLKARTSTP